MGWKACENLPNVRIGVFLKFEGDACRNMSVMLGQTDRQTDEYFLRHRLDE